MQIIIILLKVNEDYIFNYYFDNFNLLLYNPVSKNVNINNNSFKKKLKILILSTDNRNLDYIQLHKKCFENYSNLHDYTFLFEQPCDNLPIYYCKYQRILKLMDQYPDYDYFLWIDSDTIINKNYLNFPLESMIEQVGNDIDFIYISVNLFKDGFIRDVIEYFVNHFNGGFYMFKNNSQVKKLLQSCIDYIDYSKWTSFKKATCSYGGECYDEAAVFYNIKDNKELKSTRITGNFMDNGIVCNDGYFIVHNAKKSIECTKKFS